ncbi:MAG: FkbM family methyltransferase [Verrucomicrobiae bacterium]|nr:FkbM family methyltransferase [Verrucomicrobiae bacterium]
MRRLDKFEMARRILLRPPGVIHRMRLYVAFRIFAARWAATESFDLKIREVLASPDNARIPKVNGAGTLQDGCLIMHNGVRVVPNSYVGEGMTRLLRANGGVHEPQEEFAFSQVLRWLSPKASMLELGSYWAFYSLWFGQCVAGAKCFCVEPEEENLHFGQMNFETNGRKARFLRAFVGESDRPAQEAAVAPTRCVDSLMREFALNHLDLLHADIQGHELEMLQGARESLEKRNIDYVFISSHSNRLHYECLDLLERSGYVVLADADLLETFSHDGVIVAGRKGLPHLQAIPISKKKP